MWNISRKIKGIRIAEPISYCNTFAHVGMTHIKNVCAWTGQNAWVVSGIYFFCMRQWAVQLWSGNKSAWLLRCIDSTYKRAAHDECNHCDTCKEFTNMTVVTWSYLSTPARSILWEYVLHPHYLYTTCSITCFSSLSFVQLYITKLNDNDYNVCHKWYLHNCFTKWQNGKCSYIIPFESHYPLQLWMYCCNALPQYLPLLCSLWHKVFNRNKLTCEILLNNLSLYVRAVKVTMSGTRYKLQVSSFSSSLTH